MIEEKELETAIFNCVRALLTDTQSSAFLLPIPNTEPQLFVAVGTLGVIKDCIISSIGSCVFCEQLIGSEKSTSYGHDPITKAQTYAHWDCYREALNARLGAAKDSPDGD